jgi:pimeloyl-ACP methyl ester carboxylesterase
MTSDGYATRPVLLPFAGGTLSARFVEPETNPVCTLIALHGAGMSAAYFDAASHGRSLMAMAARHQVATLSIDRPGYGNSRDCFPDGLGVVDQAAVIAEAVDHFFGGSVGPVAIYGHSLGGMVALALAATRPELGVRQVEVCGLGDQHTVPEGRMAEARGRAGIHRHWGPVRLYPPGTFVETALNIAQPIPPLEWDQVNCWRRILDELAPLVECRVDFSFGEHEGWWRCEEVDREQLSARFTRASVNHWLLPGCGHNISLGREAATHHAAVVKRALSSRC